MGGAVRAAGTPIRLIKSISIIHPQVSGSAKAGAIRISVRRASVKNPQRDCGPGFGGAPTAESGDFLVKANAEQDGQDHGVN